MFGITRSPLDLRSGAVPLLLDLFTGAAVAYSLRKLRTAYSGACIRVRRSSDNTEQDIGFTNNVLNTTTLLEFCGAGSGFVTRWYDQSGNANDGIQATATQQPQIVSSGTVLTDAGTIAALFDDDFFNLTTAVSSSTWSVFGVSRKTAAQLIYFARAVGNPYSYANWNDGNIYLGDSLGFRSTPAISSRVLICTHDQASDDLVMRRNGAPVTMSGRTGLPGGGTTFDVFGRTTSLNSTGYVQEAVFWQSSQVANQSAIEANINSYWSVY